MNTCQIQQTTKTLKYVPANNSSLKVNPRGLAKVPKRAPSQILLKFWCIGGFHKEMFLCQIFPVSYFVVLQL